MSERTIQGVPETITRQQYRDAITALGIDPAQLRELRWGHDGIHAVVYALNEHGQRYQSRTAGSRGPAVHEIHIRVVDPESEAN